MVLVGAHPAPLADLERHRTRHDVAAGQILGGWRIALHEALALAVGEVPALAARAFGDEHARAVDAGRVELHELHVLQRQPGTKHHGVAIARAGVGGGGGVIGAPVAACRQHHRLRAEAVDGAIIEAPRHYAAAHPADHDEVDGEIFDEEVGIVLQALLVESVQHRMARAVGRGAGALDRRPLAHVLHMPAERALVDGPVVVAAERHARVLEFIHRLRRLAHHVLDGVLVTEPVGTLHGIVHVPGPVIRRIVAQAGGDAALCGHGMRAGGKHLGDVRRPQAGLGRAHGGAQARPAGTDHHYIVGMVDDGVAFPARLGAGAVLASATRCAGGLGGGIGHQAAPPAWPANASRAMLNRPNAAPANIARLSAAMAANLFPGVCT